jgi:hypothetical protein
MKQQRELIKLLAATLSGVAYIYVLSLMFGHVLVPNPINQWLIEDLAKTGNELGYNVAIYTHDLLVYVVVAIPFAVMLSRLPPKNAWKYLLFALGASLLSQYWILIAEPSRLVTLVEHWQFFVGLGISMTGLPIAFALITAFHRDSGPPSSESATEA